MALTMIGPASNWFGIVKLLLVHRLKTNTVNGKESPFVEEINKSSDCLAQLVNKIWLSGYPQYWYLIYENDSEINLHFE